MMIFRHHHFLHALMVKDRILHVQNINLKACTLLNETDYLNTAAVSVTFCYL